MSVKPSETNRFSFVLVRILEQVETLRGASFINKITPLLAEVINADYTFVGRVSDDMSQAHTLCLCEGIKQVDDIQYSLHGTPCQTVSSDRICFHAEGVGGLFPGDPLLVSMGIEAYLGAPLHGPDGHVIGLLVAMFKKPIGNANAEEITTLFKVFAGRIAAEVTSSEMQLSLEQALEKSHQLQEQYQRLAHQERDARQRAQKANNVKSAFLANISHEVKTPMNGMLAMCQMLLKSELNQSQRLHVQSMLDAGQQLMVMLNDVLELSRLEDGIVELPENTIPSHEMLDRVVEQASSQVQQKPINVSYRIQSQVPPYFILAEHQLQKVITNLLANAIKFTARGNIHLDVDYAVIDTAGDALNDNEFGSKELGALTIAVADTGIGIDPNFIPEIFEPFTQQNTSNTRVYGGAGLGLHLAHRLITVMGGSIDVESVQGQGSVFTVRLPVKAPLGMPRAVNLPLPLGVLRLSAVGAGPNEAGGVSDNTSQHCLAYLGAKVVEFNTSIPLTLQLARSPVAGIIIDCACDEVSIQELGLLAQEVAQEGLACAVVVSKNLVANSACADVLSQLVHACSPVLMQEWLSIIEVLQPQPNAAVLKHKPADERILLVEDNRLNQEIALCILQDAGYEVDVANNGQEAVDTIAAQRDTYAMILMDIQMPIMDGLEATRIIRTQLNCHIPVIAVTAGIAMQDRQLCDEAGMDDFIPKPIDEDFVLQKVRYYASGMNLPAGANLSSVHSPSSENPARGAI